MAEIDVLIEGNQIGIFFSSQIRRGRIAPVQLQVKQRWHRFCLAVNFISTYVLKVTAAVQNEPQEKYSIDSNVNI